MNKFFKFYTYETNFKTEVIAGITTFLTMAYILGVNVGILSTAGLPANAVFLATAVSAAAACIFMGIYSNSPIALAPGMGLNAFFTYTVVLGYGYTWQEALAMVFLSGVIFLIISLFGLRKLIIESIPTSLKQSIGAGIGFFISFIGLVKMGVIVASPATLVTLGNFKNPTVLLALFGLFITIILMSLEFKSSIFIGLFITAVFGIILNKAGISGMPTTPNQIVSVQFDTSVIGAFVGGLKSIITKPQTIIVVFTMLFVDFFDTAGTLIAVTNKINNNGRKNYDMDKMFYSDAIGTIVGSAFGTSNVTSYIESTSGVAVGGRTGLTSIVVGLLFLLSTLFSPLLAVISGIEVNGVFLEPVVAPSLVVVGVLMATQLSNVDWHDFSAASSGFITIIVMILSYSIADGIAAGFIVYVLSKLFTNKNKEIGKVVWLLFTIFLLYFISR
ncbi:NCS2 family permease [Streptobacillus moniliformis]|uniref:NCS2 family permease n=1 Tax=Streptobacillus moniliformis TaxID=34105 RepID=UPI0007E3CD75|nr:NCS2 family permease [Streptobacillus moniliformis]